MIASFLSGFAHAIIQIIKAIILVLVAWGFMAAINTFVGLLGLITAHTVIGEVFGMLSACLPFDASSVFGAIATTISAILTFMVARKIFDMYKEVFAAI